MAEQDADTTNEQTGTQATTPETGATTTDGQQSQDVDWQAEAVKWKALSRQNEAQAKANADKAKQFDAFQESQKSELEKAQDEASKWKTQYEQAKTHALRAETAAKNNIPVTLLTGNTEEELDAQVKALLAFKTPTPPASSGIDTGASARQPTTFTRQQIADPTFYHAHRDEILKAQQAGRIIA
jgi:hypothetical protein